MDDENNGGGFTLALIGCPLVLVAALVVLILVLVVAGVMLADFGEGAALGFMLLPR